MPHPVTVRILHQEAGPTAGQVERWVAAERAALAERHLRSFSAAGAADVAIVGGPPDDTPFGARLRRLVRVARPGGLVVLGSGAIPLARPSDYGDLVAAAAADRPGAVANNRYSADVVAVSDAAVLADVPDLPGDNALPRWLEEVARVRVDDLRRRWRLGIDVDGPLELVLLGFKGPPDIELDPLRERMAAVRAVAADRRAELLVSGRVSVATLAWLQVGIPARVRALVEERGLRAASTLAQETRASTRPAAARRPASVLGMLLDRDGPGCLATILTGLGEAAVVDTRVLLAHRHGPDERRWPPAEDRFASDLQLADRIRDPWLRELTAAASGAPVPVLLGGHSLVGPGLRLLLRPAARRGRAWT
jgi:hypothetical protein